MVRVSGQQPPPAVEGGSPHEIEAVSGALDPWFDELEGMLARDGESAPRLCGQSWCSSKPAPSSFALFDARAISAAVFDKDGKLIEATAAFAAAGHDQLVDIDQISRSLALGEALFEHGPGSGDALIAYAPASLTATWRLPEPIHEAGQANKLRAVVLTAAPSTMHEALSQACRTYGMSGLQTRVALATIHTGAIKEAAGELGLGYQTAREALAQAMKRVGVRRLPGLVRRLTTLAFGVLPGGETDLLADIWGLSPRQVSIAGLVAEGLTRSQISRVLGLSEAVVKKELEVVFSLLQVTSGAALARKVVEARAFSWMMDTTAGGLGFLDDTVEPRRIAIDPHGRQIAYSDYGPSFGKPVVVVHSSMSTRVVSRRLLHALQRAGYRPIAIDRPGFGLTDPYPPHLMSDDPFVDAAADFVRVLDCLGIANADVISRGGAQFIWALAGRHEDRLKRVVIVNPGPPYRVSGRALGPLAVIKNAFVNSPSVIGSVASLLAGQLTYRRISKLMEQWLRGSPPDEEAARDPEIVNDVYRSLRLFATGRFDGFIREQAAISRASALEPLPGRDHWRVLIGKYDVLYDPAVTLSYWRERLPDSPFEIIEDGGRLLIMTHPDEVVRALSPNYAICI